MSEYIEFLNSDMWNFMWAMTAVATGGLFFASFLPSKIRNQTITASQVAKIVSNESALLLDIREKNEFVQGHIPGSKNAPLAQLKSYCDSNKITKEQALILICETGARTNNAFTQLTKDGFQKVYVLKTGLMGWKSEGYPLIKK